MKAALLALSSCAALAVLPGCIIVVSDDGMSCSHTTSSPQTTEVRTLEAFHAVTLNGSDDVRVRIGSPQSLVVTCPEALLPYVRTQVSEGTLTIERAPGAPHTSRGVQVAITLPELDAAVVQGSGDVTINGLACAAFRGAVAGSGDLRVAGTAERAELTLDGSGDASCYGLVAKAASVRLTGSGDVQITALETLDVQLIGSGDIAYRGTPRVTKTVHGSGDLRRDHGGD